MEIPNLKTNHSLMNNLISEISEEQRLKNSYKAIMLDTLNFENWSFFQVKCENEIDKDLFLSEAYMLNKLKLYGKWILCKYEDYYRNTINPEDRIRIKHYYNCPQCGLEFIEIPIDWLVRKDNK